MSQIVIIDVQNKYRIWFQDTDLLNNIKESCSNYSSVVYVWDNIDGDDFSDEIPEEWDDKYHFDENEQEILTDGFYRNFKIIEKNYGFFRSYMGRIDRDVLIDLGKFMIKNNISDIREIKEDSSIEDLFLKKFKKESELVSLYNQEESFYLPFDLINEVRNSLSSGLTLVGGGRDECLSEFSLLLDILDIEHSINNSLTY